MKNLILSLVASAVLGSGIYGIVRWTRPAPVSATVPQSAEVVLIDRSSGRLLRTPRERILSAGGTAGALAQALYCPECRQWHPAPPPQFQDRMPYGALCATHRIPLLQEAPDQAQIPLLTD